MKDERATSTRKNIRFDNELLKEIKANLKGESFSSWVQAACKEMVHTNKKAVHTSSKLVHTSSKLVHTATIKKDTPKPKDKTKSDSGYAAKHGLPSVITEELHKKIMELSKKGLSSRKIADILPVSKASINRTITASS